MTDEASLLVLAQAATDPAAVLPLWAQLGLAAVFVIAFLTGQIIPGFLYKALKEELKEERAENARKTEVFEEKVLPALLETQSALREATELIRELEAERKVAAAKKPAPPRRRN